MSVIKFDQIGSMHLISWFSCIVTFRVSLPFDKVLELSSPSVKAVINNALHFIFLFSVDKVRWQSGEVWSV